MRLLLVVKDEKSKTCYEAEIEKLGVAFDTVSSLTQMYQTLIQNPYNGILLDLPTDILSDYEESILVHDVLENFPLVRLKYDDENNQIKALFFGQIGESKTLKDFVEDECTHFEARTIRSSRRYHIHFNVLFGKSDTELENKSVTVNVSEVGCFLYSLDDFDEGETIWISILELTDSSPIRCSVRQKTEWGKSLKYPGIGLAFEGITEQQLTEIKEWM